MKKTLLFLVVLLTFACNEDKKISKGVLVNQAGVEYCAILPNIYLDQNVGISQKEIEKTNKLVVKAFDSIVRDIELEIGQKSMLRLDDYKRQYIPSINEKKHLIIQVNGLMRAEQYDWKNAIYRGGGGGQRIFTGEFDLETEKGFLVFNGAL